MTKYLDDYNLFCLYEYVDPAYKHLFTIVKNEFTIRDGKVVPEIECGIRNNMDFLIPKGYFITFKGRIRPLGSNMALVLLKKNRSYPYEIQDIIVDYDLFAEYDESYIRMIVYTTPVDNSYPIYIYRLNKNNGVVFDTDGSKFDPAIMTKFTLPAIYILKKPYKYYKNIEGICIPSETGDSIEDCNEIRPKLIKTSTPVPKKNNALILLFLALVLIIVYLFIIY